MLLLADILCACYGRERVPAVAQPPPPQAPPPARVDPSYVNNPSLADVTFRYANPLVLCLFFIIVVFTLLNCLAGLGAIVSGRAECVVRFFYKKFIIRSQSKEVW